MTSYPMPQGRSVRAVLGSIAVAAGRGALLLPRGVLALAATLAGRGRFATAMLRPDAPGDGPVSGVPRRIWTSLAGMLIGVLALLPVGAEVLFVARGVLYGLVDHGPYDNAWGGPTMAGAWAAHLAISIPLAALGLVVLAGLDALHRRLGAPLVGRRTPAWAVPLMLLCCAGGALLFVSWLHQL